MILLRDYAISDAPTLARLANNRNVSRYLIYRFPYPYTEGDASWWITTGAYENGAITKAIEMDGKLVGSVGVQPQPGWKKHCAEIGYWVGEPYWGKGIATEALRQMTRISVEARGFRKLCAPVLGPNLGSMRVLEKCEYVLEGVLRGEVFKNGTYYDVHCFARSFV